MCTLSHAPADDGRRPLREPRAHNPRVPDWRAELRHHAEEGHDGGGAIARRQHHKGPRFGLQLHGILAHPLTWTLDKVSGLQQQYAELDKDEKQAAKSELQAEIVNTRLSSALSEALGADALR